MQMHTVSEKSYCMSDKDIESIGCPALSYEMLTENPINYPLSLVVDCADLQFVYGS